MKTFSAVLSFAVVLLTAGTGVAVAGDNATPEAMPKDAVEEATYFFVCDDLDCAWLLRCTSAAPTLMVSVADCCVPGDVWRANIVNRSGTLIESTSNQDAGGVAFAPDVFSPEVGAYGTAAYVTLNTSNPIPGGFAAGFTLKVRSLGADPACTVLAAEPSGP
ncbi:MAG: hypothetical protein U9Q81_18990 [Pseudomonadota bacterium]|nr:hypothetical protein [Pseudomonadota bacterium]